MTGKEIGTAFALSKNPPMYLLSSEAEDSEEFITSYMVFGRR
jgi:hypothetical protein